MRLDHYFFQGIRSLHKGADPADDNDALLTFPTYAILFTFRESGTNRFSGDYSEEETPVPIPNTAVKLLSGDGTMVLAMGE